MLRQNGIGHEKAKATSVLSSMFRKKAVLGKQISSRCSQDHTTNNVNTTGPSLYRVFIDAKEENGLNNPSADFWNKVKIFMLAITTSF